MNEHTHNIIQDTLVLVACSAVLGGLSYMITKFFTPEENPALQLITAMKKAEADEVNATTIANVKSARRKGMKDFKKILGDGLKAAKEENQVFVNMVDDHGRTPIMWACYANYNNIESTLRLEAQRKDYLAILLDQEGLTIDQRDKDAWTALHWAAWSGMDTLGDMLIAKGADFNAKESADFTPLMLAAMRGNYPMVKLLIDKGADADAVNKDGKNALQLAEEGAKAYNASWDFSKTHVSKVDTAVFTQALTKTLAEKLPDVNMDAKIAETLGHQTKVEVSEALRPIVYYLVEQKFFTQTQADEFTGQVNALIPADARQDVDVRGEAFTRTIELLRAQAAK